MKPRDLFIALFLGCLSSSVVAQDIGGNWKAETQGRGGPQEVTFSFAVDGGNLTGTMTGGMGGGSSEILNGTIEGNEISFDVAMNMGDQQMSINYTGVLEGDILTLNVNMAGRGGGGRAGNGPPGGGGRGGMQQIVATRVVE